MWLFTMYIFFKLCLFVLLTLFPSLILFTFARSPSLSKSRSSGLGECLFFLRWPSYSCCFLLLALCSASPGLSKKSDNRCSCHWLYVSARKHGVAVLFWPFLLEATLVNSGLFSPFLFHFSMWFFVLKTLLRYIGLCLHKCYPECFFKWAIDFFINLWSDSF